MNLATSDLDGIPITRREVVGFDVRRSADVVDILKGIAGCRVTTVVGSVCLVRDVAHDRALRDGSFEWDDIDSMDYMRHGEYMEFPWSGIFPIEIQAEVVIELARIA